MERIGGEINHTCAARMITLRGFSIPPLPVHVMRLTRHTRDGTRTTYELNFVKYPFIVSSKH